MTNFKMGAEDPREGLFANAFVFTDVSRLALADHDINKLLVRNVMNHMMQINSIRGHLFLNEVLDALVLERTSNGATDGWFGRDVEWDTHESNAHSPQIVVRFYVEPAIYKKLPGWDFK